jgi:hypothetical protein
MFPLLISHAACFGKCEADVYLWMMSGESVQHREVLWVGFEYEGFCRGSWAGRRTDEEERRGDGGWEANEWTCLMCLCRGARWRFSWGRKILHYGPYPLRGAHMSHEE